MPPSDADTLAFALLDANLRNADGQTYAILDSITDAFCCVDSTWQLLFVNRPAERISGRSRNDLIGKNLFDLYPMLVGTDYETQYRKALVEQTAVHFEAQSPHSGYWHAIHVYPTRQALFIFFRNITERKQQEFALQAAYESERQARQEVQRLNWRPRQAMTETHHRINNSLQTVIALIDLQSLDAEDTIPVSEYIRLTAAVRALASVHDILTQEARGDGDGSHISAEPLFDKLLPMLRLTAAARPLKYEVER